VVTFHSVLRHKRHLLRAANVLARISSSAVVWSAVSDLVAEQVRDALGSAEVVTLPNGVDLAFWDRKPAERSRGGVVTLVSTMRLYRKKQPLELLRAFARAAERVKTEVRLLIVGDGPERAPLDRAIADFQMGHGRGQVTLLGWLDRNRLRARYGECDIFTLASTRESFGIEIGRASCRERV